MAMATLLRTRTIPLVVFAIVTSVAIGAFLTYANRASAEPAASVPLALNISASCSDTP
jgi:hypothetical protein